MAYRVAVLDDMTAELRRTEEMLSTYGAAHPERELETACFTSVKAFMDSVCRAGKDGQWAFDILVMDIYLPDGNGMECARTLRERGYEGMIVFQSSSEDYAFEAYQVDAIQYLLKPVSQERFFAAVDKAVKEMKKCRKDRSAQEVDEQFVWQDRDRVLEERKIYGHSIWFLIDILRTKWNSRKNG